MTTALQQALQQITALTEALDPEEQARAAEKLQALADELKREREWNTLLATAESQTFLKELREEALAEFAAEETVEGVWE
jgi:transcription antitermination factor NusA-like protein